MFDEMGLEWPDSELGPLCPGVEVEEADLESLPGAELGASEVWWLDSRDIGDELAPCLVGLGALDARLSLELAKKAEERAKLQATANVAQAFFQVRTQGDLERAFVLLSQPSDRYHIAQGIISLAVERVVRIERRAKQKEIDGLRELNRAMSQWARSVGYRVSLDEDLEPVSREPRDQSWVVVELRPGIGQVCRGRNAGDRPVVMCEPEIFGLAVSA